MTLASDVLSDDAALEATEESMKIYGIQQDVENQAQATQVRHRKENVSRRLLELHHTISDGKDTFSHHQVTIEEHKDPHRRKVTTDYPKPTKQEDVDDVPSSVTREVLHVEVHTVINEEVQRVNQESLVYEEHTGINTEEKSSTLIFEDLLGYIESKRYQEHEVPPTSNEVLKSDLNLEMKENSCSTSNVNDSPSVEKTIISQEISEGASICHVTVTSDVYQESQRDAPGPPPLEYGDDLDIPDVKRQHKKLVTPVSAADRSPSDQGEEAMKTWEHLQETAVRLALHCDLLQADDEKFEPLGSEKFSKTTTLEEMHFSRTDEQDGSVEHLENTSHEAKEIQKLSSEQKEQSEKVCEYSKSEEDNQHHDQEQNIEKMKKRVHFSLSTEERDQMFGLTSEDTVDIKVDLIQEETLEPTTEYRDQLPNSHPRPDPNNEKDNLGLISNSQDIEPSMMDLTSAEDQVNSLHMGGTVWYDEIKTGEEMWESIRDMTYHIMNLGFRPEETLITIPEKSLKKLYTEVRSVEEIQDSEEEPTQNSMSTPHELILHSGVDCEIKCNHGEGPCSFNKVESSFVKSPEVVSDQWKQDGSNFDEGTSVCIDVISQSREEIKVDHLVNKDIEPLKQYFHAEGDSEGTDSKEELFGLWYRPSVEENEDSTNGGLTSMTDKLNLHESVIRLQGEPDEPSETTAVVYTPDEGYNQTSVQELDISKNEQLQGDMIGIESERHLLTDSTHIEEFQTAEDPAADEDHEGCGGSNLPMKTETEEEDKPGMEYEDVEDIREVQIQEIEDYSWYTQNSYQSDGLVTYSDSNEALRPQKDQNPIEKAEELLDELSEKDSETEVISEDVEAGQTNRQVSGSDEDPAKVNHLYIVSEAEPRNTSLSANPEDALGSNDELEGICRPPETGFNLLSEIQSVIKTSQSGQDISEVTWMSDATHSAVSSGNTEKECTESDFLRESNFQIDNDVKDLDLQCMLMPGHPVDQISDDLAAKNQTSIGPDEESGDQSQDRVKELDTPLYPESLAENHIEVILDQNFEIYISEPQEESDLLSELYFVKSVDYSAMSMDHEVLNVGQSAKGMVYVGHSNEENVAGILSEKITIEEHENLEECSPGLHVSEELGTLIEPKQLFEDEHCSSIEIAVTETEMEVSGISLDNDNTSVEISENKVEEDGQAGEEKSSVSLDETSSRDLENQPLDSVTELEFPLDTGSSAENHSKIFLDQNFEVDHMSEPHDSSNLVSGLNSVISVDHFVMSMDHEVLGIMSTMNVGQSDEGMEDVGHSNDENITGILSEKIIVEEHKNLEERSPGLHLSDKLKYLIEPKQIFENEHYSSTEISVTETETEVCDVGLDINNTSVEIGENKEECGSEGENKSYVCLDETSSGNLGDQPLHSVKEMDLQLDIGSYTEDNIEVIVGPVSDLYTGTLEEDGDLLSSMDPSVKVIVSTMNVYASDKRMEDGGQSNDEAIVKHHEDLNDNHPDMCLSEELGSNTELKHTFEEHHYSSIVVTETPVEAADINNDSKKTEGVLIKETDLSSDTHCDLIPDHAVEKTSEKKVEPEQSQSFESLDDASRRQFRDLEVNGPVIPLEIGYFAEDVILGSTSELSQGEGDLLSDIHSVETTDHPTEVISLISTTGEQDILDTSKAWDILEVQIHGLPDTVTLDEHEKIQNDISAISHPEELGCSLQLSQELEENQHNSSSLVLMKESRVGLDIVSTSEENVNVLQDDHEPEEIDLLSEVQSVITRGYSVEVTTITSTVKLVALEEASGEDIFPKSITADKREGSEETTQELCPSQSNEELEKKLHEQDSSSASLTTDTEDITGFDINESSKTTNYFGLSGLEIRILPGMDPITQEAMEEEEEQLSNEEALRLGQNKQVITTHTKEPSKVIEPPTHMEMSEDQKISLVDNKGTLMEPTAEEDDDVVDTSLLSHNTLDVSAQKSRVQLRRKTSIRRKQGQRKVTSESEPLEPPQPVIRPRPMGLPMFPGKMPIFAMAPAVAPTISNPAEEEKEEKLAEEEILVKPKKGIPRHAGFGMPHPQMMQELQARLKKKKPNE